MLNKAELIRDWYDDTEMEWSFGKILKSEMSYDEWHAGLTSALLKALGIVPKAAPMGAQVLSCVELPKYSRLHISFYSERSFATPAYLLIPRRRGRLPGVLAIPGHGAGVCDIVGLNPDGTERPEASYEKDFACELALRGNVVLAIEPLGFGELMLEGEEGNSCRSLNKHLLAFGRTLLGARVMQAAAGITLLSGHEKVRPGKLGVMGVSGGATVASFLAMLDPRVLACVLSGYPCMYKDSILSIPHCDDNYMPGLLHLGECCDYMSLIAPRHMLWESGDADPIFPRAGVLEAERTVRAVYELLRKPNRFVVDYFEGGHEISGALAYDFLRRSLRG